MIVSQHVLLKTQSGCPFVKEKLWELFSKNCKINVCVGLYKVKYTLHKSFIKEL